MLPKSSAAGAGYSAELKVLETRLDIKPIAIQATLQAQP
jgi:hypothetical protein